MIRIAALALALASPVLAQEPARVANGQTFGAWTVGCEAIAVGETACVLNQQLLRASDRAFLAQLLVLWSADGQTRYLAAQVPLGTYLAAGLAMKPESADVDGVLSMTWQSCNQTFCEALLELDDATLAALTAEGETIIASYRPSIQSEAVVFRFSMAGADKGLNALRPRPAE